MTKNEILSQVPTILIATSSLLIDQVIRVDLIEERFRCQVLLWLCVVLSLHTHYYDEDSTDEGNSAKTIFEIWVNLIIVSNVGSIAEFAALGPIQKSKGSRQRWLFPFSAWTAMLSSSRLFSGVYDRFTQLSVTTFSIQVYIVSIASCWIFLWHRKRTKRLQKEWKENFSLQTIQINYKDDLDPSQWYNWGVPTTLRWISTVLGNNDDGDDRHDNVVIQQLAIHRIQGSVLHTLTVPQLLALGVPYGPACQLAHTIQSRLLRPFPQPREMDTMTTSLSTHRPQPSLPSMQQDQTDWLTLHDQEYNSSEASRFKPLQRRDMNTMQESQYDHGEIPTINPEQEERMESIMKERFGLELPKLKKPGVEANHDLTENPPIQKISSPSKAVMPPVTKTTLNNNPSLAAQVESKKSLPATIEGIPPSILATMPPQIQEIAKRRPDLVRQMLNDHQKRNQKQQEEEEALNNKLPEQEEEEDDDDDERTSLIRRKPRRQKYESTR